MKLRILTLIFVGFGMKCNATEIPKEISSIEDKCLSIHHRWIDEAFILTKNCVGFSAPVSGRAYNYFSIGMYESTIELMPQMQSLSGQLNRYNRTVWKGDLNVVWPLVVNSADFELLSHYYRNMPPANRTKLTAINDSIRKLYVKHKTESEIQQSIEYGKKVALEIIEWSKSDGADNGFNENFPKTYEPPTCESCWEKTVPGYLPSLLPYWGKNGHLLNGTSKIVEGCQVLDFSTDTSSMLFKDAYSLYLNGISEEEKYEIIAEYWDDSPGYSGTPTGHFYTLAKQLSISQNLPLDRSLELYAKLGIAINEAFISCWELKFEYNFIRPVTYIQRYIDPQFNTRIASPPFPEFPSGHSYQSGAASEVLISFFTDSITFTDHTNEFRSDINGEPRTFHSLKTLSKEISTSRFYGGIHFMNTLNISLDYGRKIGQYVSNEIKCRK